MCSAKMNDSTEDVKVLVLSGFGINCEEETAAAFRLAGASSAIHHVNDLFERRVTLSEFDILALPGGFSFGDDLGSGRVLANKIRYKRMSDGQLFFDEIVRFIGEGGFILGICNGFQVLVKTGLLPNVSGSFSQEVTLSSNDSLRYEDRWCRVAKNAASKTPFLDGLDLLELPVRHGEGKLVTADNRIRKEITERGLACLAYCDASGRPTMEYPANPNGSEMSSAGLIDTTGRILGMMPHPEAFLSLFNHPDWPRIRRMEPDRGEEGQGLAIFRNVVRHIERSRGLRLDRASRPTD